MSTVTSSWGSTRRRLCVLTVLLATATSSLMQTFLTVSLPTATAELNAVVWYGWVMGIYLAAATLFIAPWAIVSDRIGPRTIHVAGMTIWMLGTWAVSLAGSSTWLLLARAAQGIGAAAVVPAGFAAIIAVYHDRYGRLIGLMGAVQASITLAGGPLGGWLGTWLGWRSLLHIVALAAVLPILLGLAVGSVIGGVLAERRDTTRMAWFIVLVGLLLAWAPFVTTATIGSAFAAAGVGLGLPTQLIAVERVSTAAHAAKAGGIIQGARNIGGALGVGVLGVPLQLGAVFEADAKYAFAIMLGLATARMMATMLPVNRKGPLSKR